MLNMGMRRIAEPQKFVLPSTSLKKVPSKQNDPCSYKGTVMAAVFPAWACSLLAHIVGLSVVYSAMVKTPRVALKGMAPPIGTCTIVVQTIPGLMTIEEHPTDLVESFDHGTAGVARTTRSAHRKGLQTGKVRKESNLKALDLFVFVFYLMFCFFAYLVLLGGCEGGWQSRV